MKKRICIVMALFLIAVPLSGAIAMDKGHGSHDQGKMDHSGHAGKMLREATVDGYALAYHLIDMREKIKDMPKMKNTHHLMVYITDPNGKKIEDATVGFLLKDPTDGKQKAMTMGMGGGYGADVKLDKMGAYGIKTKIVIGGKKIMDQFDHHIH